MYLEMLFDRLAVAITTTTISSPAAGTVVNFSSRYSVIFNQFPSFT